MQEEFPAVVTPVFKTMAPNEQMAQVANFAAFLDEIGPEADAHPLAGSAVGKRVHRYGRPRGQGVIADRRPPVRRFKYAWFTGTTSKFRRRRRTI